MIQIENILGTQYTDRGSKRKLEGLVAGISKKQRVHNDIENNLGVKKVPNYDIFVVKCFNSTK